MNYRIRTAVRTDEGRIRELFLEMLRTIYRTEDVKGYPDGYLDRFWSGSEDRIYVADIGGEAVGFLSVEVHHDPVDHLYLDAFSVMAACRNKGIGSDLLRAAEAYAGETGSQAVILHVEKTNTSAMRFYEQAGYSVFRDDGNRFLLKKGYSYFQLIFTKRSKTAVCCNGKKSRKKFLAGKQGTTVCLLFL